MQNLTKALTVVAPAKTYTIAGVACKNNVYYARFANDAMRFKALVKDGQTDIRLVELPHAMSKEEAVALLSVTEGFLDANAQLAFTNFSSTTTTATRANRQNNEAGEQLYNFCGVACKNGEYKVRWANTADRYKALAKDGQTDIRLVALASASTKFEAVQAVKDLEMFEDIDAQRAFDDFLTNNIVIAKIAVTA